MNGLQEGPDEGPYELLRPEDFLPADRQCVWTANIVGGSLVDLAPFVAQAGGNIAPGIGDSAYPELGAPANHEIIRQVVDIARAYDREIATPDDVRKILRLPAAAREEVRLSA